MKTTVWTAGGAIKARRNALRLSLDDLGAELGVSKAFMSYVEADKRALNADQAAAIAKRLGVPVDLLLLSSGRMPKDVEIAIQHDAPGVAASVRQRLEQRALEYPTSLNASLPQKRRRRRQASLENIPQRIQVSKTTSAYRAHSYHTKVPPEAIIPFIKELSEPGDTVLDLFCGSGMTGVAALIEGRNSVLSDLSPAAVHISRNYTTYCDPVEFEKALALVSEAVEPTMRWLYCSVDKPDQTIEYTTWSDILKCPHCEKDILYWDVVQSASGTTGTKFECPHCTSSIRKGALEWVGELPVQTHVSNGSTRVTSHKPTKHEKNLIQEANSAPIPYWYPTDHFGSDREMWRSSHAAMGINDVSKFFTNRNLHALAALRHAIVSNSEGRLREALMFAFTACVNRASKRYQWNAKRPTNVMTGTLYISSLRYEWNVWSLFRRKAADVRRYFEKFPSNECQSHVMNRSATNLDCIPKGAISMVFMDPPFGSNIFYADSSLLWESWLGVLTDDSEEIVVNKSRARIGGGKTLEDYGSLMSRSFVEVERVLQANGYAVLAFSNSDDKVWLEVQRAIEESGLTTKSVHILDKGQPSIKGVKGVQGKERVTTLDLLIVMQKQRTKNHMRASLTKPDDVTIDESIVSCLASRDGRIDEIYTSVLRDLLASNYSVVGVTMPMIESRLQVLGAVEKDGTWATPANVPVSSAKDIVKVYISDNECLPSASLSKVPSSAPSIPFVQGGRSSAFYNAHSYHTKVPPESITPFIEYFTKPGDVVLDPFCGSGMTGVAAAMQGRKAVLNDLSPAAVHLAWNHTTPIDPRDIGEAFSSLEKRVGESVQALYGAKHTDGSMGIVHWTMWSTKHKCPECKRLFLLWDAIDRESGRLGNDIACPHCQTVLERKRLDTIQSVPAWISYTSRDGKRHQRALTKYESGKILKFSRQDISDWYPRVSVDADREMYIRCALHLKGISEIADFYTPRNLKALATLWAGIQQEEDERKRLVLTFAFTNTAWHGTKMRRFNSRGGQRPLTGTLYIPQLSSEANVLEVMRNKVKQLKRYYSSFAPCTEESPHIVNGSATNLSMLGDKSIDYVFTDPPFGSNLFYADCNLIWESWLGRVTNPKQEAVVNRSLPEGSGGKDLQTYERLMTESLAEIHRVLKPKGWATIVFHNTNGKVWEALHRAAETAGFDFHEASSLDRKQHSHKGYKGKSGKEDVAHFDVVMNLQKRIVKAKKLNGKKRASNKELKLDVLVKEIYEIDTIRARGAQGVHAELLRRLSSTGERVSFDYADIRKEVEKLEACT